MISRVSGAIQQATHWASAETTNQMLRALRAGYPDRCLILAWDNVRYHHAKAVRSYAAHGQV